MQESARPALSSQDGLPKGLGLFACIATCGMPAALPEVFLVLATSLGPVPMLLCVVLCCAAGVAYVVAFAVLMNFLAYLALKFYSGQQPRASVSVLY